MTIKNTLCLAQRHFDMRDMNKNDTRPHIWPVYNLNYRENKMKKRDYQEHDKVEVSEKELLL